MQTMSIVFQKKFRQRRSARIIIKRFKRCRSLFIKIQTISFSPRIFTFAESFKWFRILFFFI